MEDKHRRLLQKHAFRLQMDLTMDAVFLSLFESRCVFTDANIEAIMAKPTNSQRVSEFLIRLPKRGKTAFETLVHALMETGQEHIADDLDKFIADEWRVKNNVPTDKVEVKKRPREIEKRDEAIIKDTVWPVDDDVGKERGGNDDNYKMINRIRGRTLIINNSTQQGARYDEQNLRNLFEQLQFDHEDSHPRKTRKTLGVREFDTICNFERQQRIQIKADAFIMVVMSHGNKDGIYLRNDNNGTGDHKIEKAFDDIESYFDGKQCPGLMDKPKLLIFHTYENEKDADALVDSEYQTDTKDEENGKPGPKILEPPVKIQADAAECGKPGGPEKTHTSSASGSGQTENKASSEKQIKTPDDQKHIHEKTDICSVICHVNAGSEWGDADKGSYFIRNLIFTFLERCHDDHWEEMMTEITRLQGKINQAVTRKGTLKKSLYFLPGYPKKEDTSTENP